MGLFSFLLGLFRRRKTSRCIDKVLQVGINTYPGCPLAGCINDVSNVKGVLTSRYGVMEGNIKALLDRDATTQNILKALDWLVDVPPGARILFQFSGHGSQVPTSDPSEPDGLSEIICPVDLAWSPDHYITDKQFVQVFSRIPQGVLFNWLSDSCHSGDISRDMVVALGVPRAAVRHIPPPAHILQEVRRRMAKKLARAVVAGKLDVGYVSGCRSDQTSTDAYIMGRPCGAFTHFFVKALTSMPKEASLESVVTETRKLLVQNGYEQVPQCEGTRAGRPFLGA